MATRKINTAEMIRRINEGPKAVGERHRAQTIQPKRVPPPEAEEWDDVLDRRGFE